MLINRNKLVQPPVEIGLPFSAPMVQANLRDVRPKTETRRLPGSHNSVAPSHFRDLDIHSIHNVIATSHSGYSLMADSKDGKFYMVIYPRYKIGNVIYMREAWATDIKYDGISPSAIIAEMNKHRQPWKHRPLIFYKADTAEMHQATDPRVSFSVGSEIVIGRWRPSIHMPKLFARSDRFEITKLKYERIQDITGVAAVAEGCGADLADFQLYHYGGFYQAKMEFHELWDAINGHRMPMKSNQIVLVIGYSRL